MERIWYEKLFFGTCILYSRFVFDHAEYHCQNRFWFQGLFGSFNPPFGLLLLPVIIGIILLFAMKRQIWGWILIAIGFVTIFTGLLMGLRSISNQPPCTIPF